MQKSYLFLASDNHSQKIGMIGNCSGRLTGGCLTLMYPVGQTNIYKILNQRKAIYEVIALHDLGKSGCGCLQENNISYERSRSHLD